MHAKIGLCFMKIFPIGKDATTEGNLFTKEGILHEEGTVITILTLPTDRMSSSNKKTDHRKVVGFTTSSLRLK
jgi:hypothetical protein